ncbi:serine/threonine protein phosphatase [Sphingomonas sp. BN140010]|uniref:Serine/threonine protein phosphatase n=1 Tax=Sphingomonas arvum TaxID=2992113 RepID=A0ABT3JDU2_9SPHN|nr:metallophosphoesterase family protein [Sphingomonas sp. BN140010]MCW3797074.1 serine/threonine protein phosphatase [Sphingomonas sp. BN140010]
MSGMLRRWRRSRQAERRGVEGYRAYGIGDVHGRLDLLVELLDRIREDHAARGDTAELLLVFLGDLIDRGPDSSGVVELVRTGPIPGARTVALAGNHEEVLLRLLGGERGLLAQWLSFGGDACLASYGADPRLFEGLPESEGLAELQRLIPPEHRDFLASLADTFRFGDYLFVHAGLRPGTALHNQSPRDLRWIRQPFLDDPRDHGMTVVHGHTITEEVDIRTHRIGIDTGAYRSGVLTALAIEGDQHWLIQQRASSEQGGKEVR